MTTPPLPRSLTSSLLGLAIAAAFCWPVGPARATGVEFPELASLLAEVAPESTLVIVPVRAMDQIARDQADAEAVARTVDDTIVMARGALARAQAQVDVKKTEVENVKARAKAAKEAKNEAEQKDLERQQKQLELAQKRLERIRDMRGAEAEFAQSQKVEANTRVQLSQAERALVDSRAALDALGTSAPSTAQLEKYLAQKREVGKAEARLLESTKELASKRDDVASKARALADRRLAVIAIDQEIAARKQ